jgi:yeast amino acid transporter
MPSYNNHDIEMNMFTIKEDSLAQGSSYTMREPLYEDIPPPTSLERFIDGFRRDPSQRITPVDPLRDILPEDEASSNHPMLAGQQSQQYYDVRWANLQTAQTQLARKLKGRHLQMIAIGGSIGTFSPPSLTPSLSLGKTTPRKTALFSRGDE